LGSGQKEISCFRIMGMKCHSGIFLSKNYRGS
jgi:hypothetical protein